MRTFAKRHELDRFTLVEPYSEGKLVYEIPVLDCATKSKILQKILEYETEQIERLRVYNENGIDVTSYFINIR